MKIVSGKYRGLQVECPPGQIRPAMGRMRKSMFSIFGDEMNGKKFLDLFSGSGIMALEAASRGASEIWLIEKDRKKAPVIYKNLRMLEEDVVVKVLFMDVWNFIRKLKKKFDYIHLDPTYDFENKKNLLEILGRTVTLDEKTTITLHYKKCEKLNYDIGNLVCYDTRFFGQSCLAFYHKK